MIHILNYAAKITSIENMIESWTKSVQWNIHTSSCRKLAFICVGKWVELHIY